MYEAKEYTFHDLDGISGETMNLHLGLYKGYVANTNHVMNILKDEAFDTYAKRESNRRLPFEFNGMRNHEYFFEQFTGGISTIPEDSNLAKMVTEQFGSIDNWIKVIKETASTRGVGWMIAYYDLDEEKIINIWCDEQQLGHLNSCHFIFGIDMWEHSYMRDYLPADKGQYIDAVVANTNWELVAMRLPTNISNCSCDGDTCVCAIH